MLSLNVRPSPPPFIAPTAPDCPSSDLGCSAVCTGTVGGGTATGTATATSVSYVSDQYFVFPAIATSFADSDACFSALSECSTNYGICTSDLVSGGFGVTVVVPGTTTIEPTLTALPLTSATSICASLSSKACYDLQSAQCAQTGTSSGFYVGSTNAGPRPTAACRAGVVAAVGIGMGMGMGFLGA
jgi:hypothetical protein